MLHFQKAVEIRPDYAEAQNNLGAALFKRGQVDEAARRAADAATAVLSAAEG